MTARNVSPHSVGDDGDPATRWEDTYIKQEFDALYAKWQKWLRENESEFPSDEFGKFVAIADTTLCAISDYMTGKI